MGTGICGGGEGRGEHRAAAAEEEEEERVPLNPSQERGVYSAKLLSFGGRSRDWVEQKSNIRTPLQHPAAAQ